MLRYSFPLHSFWFFCIEYLCYNCFTLFTGYSGSDLQALCEEAAMMPIRELGSNILTVKANQACRFQNCFKFCCGLLIL